MLEDEDFFNFKISVKSSDVFLAIAAYKQLSNKGDYLAFGNYRVWQLYTGSIKSSIGIGSLLLDGNMTQRVPFSDDPVKEIKIANEILKSLNLRNKGKKLFRVHHKKTRFDVIKTVKILEEKLSHIKTPITLSIIGCVVNDLRHPDLYRCNIW